MFWYRRIVDFDQNSQVELARDAKNAIETRAKQLKALINRRLAAVSEWLQRPWDLMRLSVWTASVAVTLALILSWRGYGRVVWLRWRSSRNRRGVDPVRREAARWLRRLAQKPERPAGEDWESIRADLERLRYGPREGWPNPRVAFSRAKRACGR
jgi:hypothetical protein